MTLNLPKIKKNISDFLTGEEGKISKKALVAIGTALAGVTAATAATHTSSTNINYAKPNIQGSHSSSVSTTGTTGSCCLPGGTKVLMGDGSLKNIEDVQIGERVMGYDENTHNMTIKEVLGLKRPLRDYVCKITFDDNTELRITNDHPIYTAGGWKAIDPSKSEETYFGDETVQSKGRQNSLLLQKSRVLQLQTGDRVMTSDLKFKTVVKIDFEYGVIQTYTLQGTCSFFVDGVLVHNIFTTGPATSAYTCLPGGTKVLMGNGSLKNIEDVQIGERVMGYDENTNQLAIGKVLGLESVVHDYICKITFDDNSKLRISRDHPIYTAGGWKAVDPTGSEEAYMRSEVQSKGGQNSLLLQKSRVLQLQIGDMVMTSDLKFKTVVKIDFEYGVIQTYTIKNITRTHSFFADGVLVHNISCDTTSTTVSTTISTTATTGGC